MVSVECDVSELRAPQWTDGQSLSRGGQCGAGLSRGNQLVQEYCQTETRSVSHYLLLLVCQMETLVSSMKVAVHRRSPTLP